MRIPDLTASGVAGERAAPSALANAATATWATLEPRSSLRTPPLLTDATDKMDLVK
jgi:hypothetical protein